VNRPVQPESQADAAGRPKSAGRDVPRSVEDRLFQDAFVFDFFQSVRVLEKLAPDRRPVGRDGPPQSEAVRFRAHNSLSFPPSAVYQLDRPGGGLPVPAMAVTFMGLTGPSGVLPRHYTELLMRLERDAKGPEKFALRDWLDQFNHRLISMFYRAWEKYRFYVPYERGEFAAADADPFTRCVFSLAGLGMPALRNRLQITHWEQTGEELQERRLAHVEDLALLRYSGLLAHRPRNVLGLQALLEDYFRLPVAVRQFQGQWLMLDPSNQSRLGTVGGNSEVAMNLVVGDRVWDVQCKIRIRIGPLRYGQFLQFLPDRSAVPQRKAIFLLSHLVRLYVGPELDFDIQVILKAEDVPECQLQPDGVGPQLGRNAWLINRAMTRDADDAVFKSEEITCVNPLEGEHRWL
jgi:type VI secretion system protein ImpH